MKKKLKLNSIALESIKKREMSFVKGGATGCTCYCSSRSMSNLMNEENFWNSCTKCGAAQLERATL